MFFKKIIAVNSEGHRETIHSRGQDAEICTITAAGVYSYHWTLSFTQVSDSKLIN
jgi:hypothetical protein